MFKKFVKAMLNATSAEEIEDVLYGENGVDILFQKDKLKWDEHEMLFELAAKLENGIA